MFLAIAISILFIQLTLVYSHEFLIKMGLKNPLAFLYDAVEEGREKNERGIHFILVLVILIMMDIITIIVLGAIVIIILGLIQSMGLFIVIPAIIGLTCLGFYLITKKGEK